MQPQGRKKVKFPGKTKEWMGKNIRMWWECIIEPNKKTERQKAKRNITNDIIKDPSICPHGNQYISCDKQECIDEMCSLEDAATCPHGFLVGCPTCK